MGTNALIFQVSSKLTQVLTLLGLLSPKGTEFTACLNERVDLYFLCSALIVGFVVPNFIGQLGNWAIFYMCDGKLDQPPSATANSAQSNDTNLPVAVAIFTTSPSDRYSGACISNPFDNIASLVLLVVLVPLNPSALGINRRLFLHACEK